MFGGPIEHQRTPGKDKQNDRTPRGRHQFEQLLLISGQTGKGAGTAFAAHFRSLAQSHHHKVRLPGGVHGGGKAVFGGCVDLCPFGVQDRSSSLFLARLQSVLDRNHSLDAMFFAPKAEHIRCIVCQGADQGDLVRPGAQRQQGSRAVERLVLKKHERFFRGLAHERAMFRHGRGYFRAFCVRAFEQPQGKLQAQHAANGFIHGRHWHLA